MENFEEFLKNEAEKFQLQPSPKVWEKVSAGVKKPARRFLWWVIAAMLFVVTGITLWIFQWTDCNRNQLTKTPISKDAMNQRETQTSNTNNPTSDTERQMETEAHTKPIATSPHSPTNKGSDVKLLLNSKSTNVVKNKPTKKSAPLFEKPPVAEVFKISQQQVTYKPSILSSFATQLMASKILAPNKPSQRKTEYGVSAGVNFSKPINSGYKDFLKPGFNFNILGTVSYSLKNRIRVSTGLGFQQNSYKIGAVSIQPETIQIETSKGEKNETALFRLNNESKQKNVRRQLVIPVTFQYLLFDNKTKGNLFVFTGLDLTGALGAKYLIKSNVNDKLFSDRDALSKLNSYSTLGLIYSKPKQNSGNLFLAIKLQFQNGNTFKPAYPLHERVMVLGLNAGVGF